MRQFVSSVPHFQRIEEARSKYSILAAFSRIYEPLGLLAMVVLVPKIILQDIWRLKGGWDEILPAEILNRWGRFVEHLSFWPEVGPKKRPF